MVRAVGIWLWVVGATATACGGHVEGGESGESHEAPASNGSSGKSQGSYGEVEGDTPLGSCKLGFDEYPGNGMPCAWVADDRCYDTREMACNCACPRTRDSQCASGFDEGPNGHVLVSCQ